MESKDDLYYLVKWASKLEISEKTTLTKKEKDEKSLH